MRSFLIKIRGERLPLNVSPLVRLHGDSHLYFPSKEKNSVFQFLAPETFTHLPCPFEACGFTALLSDKRKTNKAPFLKTKVSILAAHQLWITSGCTDARASYPETRLTQCWLGPRETNYSKALMSWEIPFQERSRKVWEGTHLAHTHWRFL